MRTINIIILLLVGWDLRHQVLRPLLALWERLMSPLSLKYVFPSTFSMTCYKLIFMQLSSFNTQKFHVPIWHIDCVAAATEISTVAMVTNEGESPYVVWRWSDFQWHDPHTMLHEYPLINWQVGSACYPLMVYHFYICKDALISYRVQW
jgi:hypothetical protein